MQRMSKERRLVSSIVSCLKDETASNNQANVILDSYGPMSSSLLPFTDTVLSFDPNSIDDAVIAHFMFLCAANVIVLLMCTYSGVCPHCFDVTI